MPTDRAVEGPEHDYETVRSALRARREAVERRELGRAFERLEAHGTLTDRQRRILARMATAILDDVLEPPEAALAADGEHDPAALRTVADLLGVDDSRTCSGERPSGVAGNDRP